jgi:hypothetical protein
MTLVVTGFSPGDAVFFISDFARKLAARAGDASSPDSGDLRRSRDSAPITGLSVSRSIRPR